MPSSGEPPTVSELSRTLERAMQAQAKEYAELRRAINDLSSKVLTEAVWQREREFIETRIRENNNDILEVKSDFDKYRETQKQEKATEETNRKNNTRMWITGLVFPLAVTFILAVASLAWQFINVSQGMASP